MTRPVAPFDTRRDLVALLPRLRRFALTLAGSVEEADELVRTACSMTTGKDWAKDRHSRPEAWLFQLVSSLSARRKTHSDKEGLAVGNPLITRGGLMLDISRDEATAFLLVEVEGFSYAEAAEILAASTDSIAARLCDARLCFADLRRDPSERRA